MSDGGGESGSEFEQNYNYNYNTSNKKKKKKKSGSEDFVQAIAKIAVAQVCESAGFQGFQQSALDMLSDVAVRYIGGIGKTATFYANLAGRTNCNVFDIIQGFEDLGLSQGFSGASDINHCLVGSGTVQEITQYVGMAEEVPFAYSIPHFPAIKDRNPTPSFVQARETPPGEHIPEWLPAFPDPETYGDLPSVKEGGADIRLDEVEQVKEHKKVERSQLDLQQCLACNGSEAPMAVDPGDAARAKRAADSNPFLAAPMQFGEKEVSSVDIPAKLLGQDVVQNRAVGANHVSLMETFVANHVSELEIFAPAIEAVQSNVCDSEERGKKVLLNTRSTVQFKLGTGKKSLGTAMRLPKESIVKTTSLFGNDHMKDEKKRRAVQILQESTENPQELA